MGIDPVSLLIYAAIMTLSLMAAKYFMSKSQSPLREKQKPTTLTERGAYTPYPIGRRRVGPIVAWAGKRGTYTKSQQTMYEEEAWHILCLGPGKRLWRIWEAGKVIWQGPITPQSDPSGSLIKTGQGRFTIYWGEETQPVNTKLGAASRVGISSRWPFMMYVHWEPKDLGASPFWPAIEYEIETGLQSTHLVNSQGYKTGTYVLSGVQHNIIAPVASGASGVGFITLNNHHASRYRPSRKVQIAGNPAAGQYTILNSTNTTTTVPGPGFFPVVQKRTVITFVETLTGVTAAGTIEVYDGGQRPNGKRASDPTDDGYNPAHMIAQLLFDPWPHGLGLPKADFSLPSFEEAGVTLEDELIPGHLLIQDGEELGSVLAGICQDIGAFFSWDPVLGLYRLHLLRNETNVLTLPEETILNPFPEIQNLLRESPVSSIYYVYQDRERAYKDSTTGDDDDGAVSEVNHKKQGKADLRLITDSVTAVSVGERRKQEERAQGAAYRLQANRGTRLIFPGQVLYAPDIEDPLRVSEVKADVNTGKVELLCFTDFYGVPQTEYEQDPGQIETPDDDIDEQESADEADDLLPPPPVTPPEESGGFFPPGSVPMLPVRIRSEVGAPAASVHVSADGLTYSPATTANYVTGGSLDAEYPVGSMNEDEGFVINVLGPDFLALIQDLSGDEERWRLGMQIVVIEREWMFVKYWEPLGGNQYKARGVLRGRFGSEPLTHDADSIAFVFPHTNMKFFKDLIISEGEKVHFKTVPDSTDIAIAPAIIRDLAEFKPRAPIGLRTKDLVPKYTDGEDIDLKWGYFHALESQIGLGRAGYPVPTPTPAGSFFLEVYDGVTLVRQVSCLKFAEFRYTNTMQIADFGVTPDEVIFKVYHVLGRMQSDPTTLTVEKR